MTPISCMIIDDQTESKELMTNYINRTSILSLKYSTTNPIDALTFLDSEKVYCLFLDIEMPEISGLEFIETLRAKFGKLMPKIILITGYNQYAVSGYDFGVFDYLLKPIGYKRFKISVDRLVESLKEPNDEILFFFADIDGQKVKINFREIAYVEAAGNYIYIVTNEKKMICYRSLTSLQEILPESKFLRVHKSFIVSIDNIQSVRGNEILLYDKAHKSIPIGITFKEKLLKTLRISER